MDLCCGFDYCFWGELVLRDFLLPENANNVSIGLALVREWVTLSFLVSLWISKVEKKNLASARQGQQRGYFDCQKAAVVK
jgi:hypothetical protein